MTNWQEWKQINRQKIAHVVDFEERFVDSVLAKIPLIKPENVTPQYPFIDHNGKNRYIDFMIELKDENIVLAIELDGMTKFDSYDAFNDFMERQNDIVHQYEGNLLRYTNKKMLNDPNSIIDEISDFLQRKKDNRSTVEIQNSNKSDSEQEIKSLILAMQTDLHNLKNQQIIPARKGRLWGGMIFLVIVIGIVLFLLFNPSTINKKLPLDWRPAQHITTSEAVNFIKQQKTVCGFVSQVYTFNRGIFINFDHKYPNQTFTAVIWNSDLKHFERSKLDALVQREICVTGVLEEFKQTPRVVLYNQQQLIIK